MFSLRHGSSDFLPPGKHLDRTISISLQNSIYFQGPTIACNGSFRWTTFFAILFYPETSGWNAVLRYEVVERFLRKTMRAFCSCWREIEGRSTISLNFPNLCQEMHFIRTFFGRHSRYTLSALIGMENCVLHDFAPFPSFVQHTIARCELKSKALTIVFEEKEELPDQEKSNTYKIYIALLCKTPHCTICMK